MTKYAVIAAMDQKGGFSRKGRIPWYFPEDFKHFREITTGHICVMGRKTYDDINSRLGEKAKEQVLPNRTSIVLSSKLVAHNAVTARSWTDVYDFTDRDDRTVFFIGGYDVFREGLRIADELYLTIIPGDYGCDLFLPMQDGINNFIMVSREDTDNGLTFVKMIRRNLTGDENN